MNWLTDFRWTDAALVLAMGSAAGCLVWRWKEKIQREALQLRAKCLLEDASREAGSIVREARLAASEEAVKLRRQAEEALVDRRTELDATERRLAQREELINNQLEGLTKCEQGLLDQQANLQRKQAEVEARHAEAAALVRERRKQLQKLARMTEAEARALILKEVEQDALKDAGDLTRHVLEMARAKAEEQARRILCLAVQRFSSEHAFENTTSTVELNGEDIKGRIIGREGRNIRAFEAATGMTVLIDDTPNAVVISGFDPVRREIARQAMERLILDGRIHPTRIEEVVAKVTEEIEDTITRMGEEAVYKAGLPPMQKELVNLLGRLHYRHSFAQNILLHSIEVAHFAGMMAAELGLDAEAARRAGLLHDIGKAANHELEGSHALIGAELARRHGETDQVVNGVASHHDEAPHTGPLGIVVGAADAISASRPGARSESMTTYLHRLENLERIGASFPGVEKCYAVQAGRELRVMVRPEEINDEQAYALARNLARRIENDLQYPGQIRVTVVRETRCVEFAK